MDFFSPETVTLKTHVLSIIEQRPYLMPLPLPEDERPALCPLVSCSMKKALPLRRPQDYSSNLRRGGGASQTHPSRNVTLWEEKSIGKHPNAAQKIASSDVCDSLLKISFHFLS